jgi:lipoprotein-releasing system permease protein|tara:strand:- start:1872 stop:3104 length:1233 start_codon:yes stop_codon:yes gene_type:complete
LKFEFLLAKRIISTKAYKSSISAPIIKIGIIAIALSVIVMLISISTGIGLQNEIRDKVSAFNGHIIISNFDSNNSDESNTPITVDNDLLMVVNSIYNIKSVNQTALKFGIIRTSDNFDGLLFKGVDSTYNWNNISDYLIEGFVPKISKSISDEVLISDNLSKKLNLNIEDSFQMIFSRNLESKATIRKFNIVGLFDSGFNEIDDNIIFGDIKHLRRINKWKDDQSGALEVFINDFSLINETTKNIYLSTPSSYNTVNVKQRYSSIFDWIKIFDKNIIAILFIMVVVCSINIISVLLVLILERTNMIGILKSIGANNKSIKIIFLIIVSYIISLGLIIGNSVGLGLLFIQNQFSIIKLDPEIYYASKVPVYLSFDYILLLNFFTFLVCLLSVLLPSYLISKISPVNSIKFR